MKKFLLTIVALVALTVSVEAQHRRVFNADTAIPIRLRDLTTGDVEQGYTVTNLTMEVVQPEQHNNTQILTNGTFADSTGWTLNGTWAVGSGTLNAVNEDSAAVFSGLSCVENIAYELIYTITSYTDGTITPDLGGTAGTARSSAATFTETIVCGADGDITFTGATSATASIDNVTVFQAPLDVTPSATAGMDYYMEQNGSTLGMYDFMVPAELIPVSGTYEFCVYDASEILPLCTMVEAMASASMDWFDNGAPTTAAIATAVDSEFGSRIPSADAGASGGLPTVNANNQVGINLDDTTGTLDASEIGTDAITAAKIAADAIGASEIATGAITTAEIAAGAIEDADFASDVTLYTIQKNVASQQFPIWMVDSNGDGITGLSDITCQISIDFAAFATTNDTTEAEVGLGLYVIDLTQAETNGDNVDISCDTAGGTAFPWKASITPQR